MGMGVKDMVHIDNGPTQVKCWLLISSIIYVMNFPHFFEMLESNLWHFWKMLEIHCIKMIEIRIQHFTWSKPDSAWNFSTKVWIFRAKNPLFGVYLPKIPVQKSPWFEYLEFLPIHHLVQLMTLNPYERHQCSYLW